MTSKRLFVAVTIEKEISDRCAILSKQLQKFSPGSIVRWVDPKYYHVTLKFLGAVPASEVPLIRTTVRKIADKTGPFSFTLQGIGGFPEKGPVNIIWMDTANDQLLLSLANKVSREFEKIGFSPDPREFSGHLTLGRVKRGSFSRRYFSKASIDLHPATVFVRDLVLFESETLGGGAIYHTRDRAPLQGSDSL